MRYRTIGFWAIAVILSLVFGFLVSAPGLIVWDDWALYAHSVRIINLFGIPTVSTYNISDNARWIAVAWPFILGVSTEYIFAWLKDPFVVRHGMNIALYPLFLVWLWRFFRRHNYTVTHVLLIIALLVGHIRLFGHAMLSLRDFPHAVGFSVSLLLSWELLQQIKERGWNENTLVALGAAGILPYLLRSPNVMPLPLSIAAILYLVVCDRSLGIGKKIFYVLIPTITGSAIAFLMTPALWFEPDKVAYPLTLFSDFPWKSIVRIFGVEVDGSHLPLWFYPAWLPVSMEPITFIAVVTGLSVGLHALIFKRKHLTADKAFMSLESWLALVTAITWILVMAIRPSDYDEDRHLLFLFPPVILLGGLWLSFLRKRVMLVLTAAIFASSLASYGLWQEYAYVYKSPLIPERHASAFMNDYRGVCLNRMSYLLPSVVPEDSVIRVLMLPRTELRQQLIRFNRSALVKRDSYPKYQLTDSGSAFDFLLISERMNLTVDLPKTKAFGPMEQVAMLGMPPYGEPACTLFRNIRNGTED